MEKDVALFVSHHLCRDTIRGYDKLCADLPSGLYDVYWLLQREADIGLGLLEDRIRFFFFSKDDLWRMGYTPLSRDTLYGSVNFILQYFFRAFPQYRNYWYIEEDAVFTGSWHTLAAAFEAVDADLLSCHIEKYDPARNADWAHWLPAEWPAGEEVPLDGCVKSFNPVCRLSGRALAFLDGFLKRGTRGHYETIVPTALFRHGYKLVDMGGTGEFVLPGFRNRFYVQGVEVNDGTMRYRPLFSREEVEASGMPGKLFHPVKPRI